MKHAHQQATSHYESSRLPYVCWYQNDFLGGVRGMRAHEIGIYTILLNEMYARGRPLELSEERLARLCGCDKRTFVNVLAMLIEEGKVLNLANGLWNKRCEIVFQERAKLLEQKSFAGRCSAKKRKKINADIEHLLKGCTRDEEQNSKAQKGEEKETPDGVSEKPFFLITPKDESGDKPRDERMRESAYSSLKTAPISNAFFPYLDKQATMDDFSSTTARTKSTSPAPADTQNTPAPANFDILRDTKADHPTTNRTSSVINHAPINPESNMHIHPQGRTPPGHTNSTSPAPTDTQNTPNAPAHLDIVTDTKADYPTTNRTSSVTNHAPINPESNMHIHPQGRTPPGHTNSTSPAPADTQNTPAPANFDILRDTKADHPTTNRTSSVTNHAPTKLDSNTHSKAKSRTATLKGQRLPSDWQADIDAAILEGLSEEQARWQEKKFRDYWHAKSGKDALKVDWQATWRNWFRREIERIKEHQERLAIFSSQSRLSQPNNENEALYRSLINYQAN